MLAISIVMLVSWVSVPRWAACRRRDDWWRLRHGCSGCLAQGSRLRLLPSEGLCQSFMEEEEAHFCSLPSVHPESQSTVPGTQRVLNTCQLTSWLRETSRSLICTELWSVQRPQLCPVCSLGPWQSGACHRAAIGLCACAPLGCLRPHHPF